jgi:hypothetical protein
VRGRNRKEPGRERPERTGALLDLQLKRRRNFRRIVKRAGLDHVPKLVPYSLRQTHISALVAAGDAIHTISDRVGHVSGKMTLERLFITGSGVRVSPREYVCESLQCERSEKGSPFVGWPFFLTHWQLFVNTTCGR